MAKDTRELILVRLKELLVSLADGTEIKVWRNRAEFEVDKFNPDGLVELPAYVLLDGDEDIRTVSSDKRVQTMLLKPQIFYIPLPTETQLNVGVGEDLSVRRYTMLKKIMQDSQLQDILGENGFSEYRGLQTDMQTGAEVKGQFRMDFAFAYVLNFNKM